MHFALFCSYNHEELILCSEAFTEDNWKLAQLVLTLFRNILAIQEISSIQKAGGSAFQYLSLRDRFLELLFHENVMDLIIVVTQHIGGSSGYFHEDNLLLLEIYHYIFLGQDSELIAKAHSEGSKVGVLSCFSLLSFLVTQGSFNLSSPNFVR